MFRGVNDLIRDAGVRLRYEADLSFSREAEREVAAAPGNTPCLPVAPHRTDILAYVLGEVTFEPVTSFNLIVLRRHLIRMNFRPVDRDRLLNWMKLIARREVDAEIANGEIFIYVIAARLSARLATSSIFPAVSTVADINISMSPLFVRRLALDFSRTRRAIYAGPRSIVAE